MKKDYYILTLLTLIGGILRFWQLGDEPLWVDEAWLYFLSFDSVITQEFIHAYFNLLFGLKDEFGLRLLPAICGTLSIPAIYFVVRKNKLLASFFVASIPLFVTWSKLGRPYAIAGLFLILAYRRWYWMIPALISTPVGLIGIVFQKKKVILGTLLIGIAVLFARIDLFHLQFDTENIFTINRFLYLPILLVAVYIFDKYEITNRITINIVAFFLGVSIATVFYKANLNTDEVIHSNWRKAMPVKYSTNILPHLYYTGNKSLYLREENRGRFINEPDTIWVGIDYYALTHYSRDIINVPEWIRSSLKYGWVYTVRAYKGKLLWNDGFRWYSPEGNKYANVR